MPQPPSEGPMGAPPSSSSSLSSPPPLIHPLLPIFIVHPTPNITPILILTPILMLDLAFVNALPLAILPNHGRKIHSLGHLRPLFTVTRPDVRSLAKTDELGLMKNDKDFRRTRTLFTAIGTKDVVVGFGACGKPQRHVVRRVRRNAHRIPYGIVHIGEARVKGAGRIVPRYLPEYSAFRVG